MSPCKKCRLEASAIRTDCKVRASRAPSCMPRRPAHLTCPPVQDKATDRVVQKVLKERSPVLTSEAALRAEEKVTVEVMEPAVESRLAGSEPSRWSMADRSSRKLIQDRPPLQSKLPTSRSRCTPTKLGDSSWKAKFCWK